MGDSIASAWIHHGANHHMSVFFEPTDGFAGDFIPFYWDGEYHLFYLKDYRDREGHGEGTPWFHLGTRDFVSFTDYGEAIPRGSAEDQDLYVFTGCVLEHEGLFHIFYTGHNPHLRAVGKPEQAIMHATSPDLITWTKDPANPILFADTQRYEIHDWRDPFIFWNDNAGEFWMLLAAREKHGPANRRGCVGLVTSPDLGSWTIQDPLWSPQLYFTHECPDLFKLGDHWYLVYSTFSERHVTHYRFSKDLNGPWVGMPDDQLDGRAYYAAKTASDGNRRFSFGWDPTRENFADTGRWQWGGSLVIHELQGNEDGSLSVHPPAEVRASYESAGPVASVPGAGDWMLEGDTFRVDAPDSFAWLTCGPCDEESLFELTITFERGTRYAGVLLKADDVLDNYYQVRLEPDRQRVVFDRWPRRGDDTFILERPVAMAAGDLVSLQVFRQGTLIVIYVNQKVALSTRVYNSVEGSWGVFVSEGCASFTGVDVAIIRSMIPEEDSIAPLTTA